ncbi:MAG: hypothetical protein ABMA64_27120 [Myxococcota bacterium]
MVELEVFGLDDLAVRRRVPAMFLPVGQLDDELRAKLAADDEEARNSVLDWVTALKVRGDVAWVGVRGGGVRRVNLKTGATTPFVRVWFQA